MAGTLIARDLRFADLPLREDLGLLRCPGAKEYALNAPGHPDMAGDMGHYTTDMSGASSAFMPTTL